jgi:predicted nucleotidyltransferase
MIVIPHAKSEKIKILKFSQVEYKGMLENTKMKEERIVNLLRRILFENKHVIFAYLFVSTARGTQGEDSDIDVAVWLENCDIIREWKKMFTDIVLSLKVDKVDLVHEYANINIAGVHSALSEMSKLAHITKILAEYVNTGVS